MQVDVLGNGQMITRPTQAQGIIIILKHPQAIRLVQRPDRFPDAARQADAEHVQGAGRLALASA